MPAMNRVQQVLLIMAIWAAALILIDKKMNTHPERTAPPDNAGKPQIVMTFEHFCCEGCYDGMFASVKHYSWLSKPKVIQKNDGVLPSETGRSTPDLKMQTKEQANLKADSGSEVSDHSYEGSALADLNTEQLGLINFVALDHTVRDEGMVMKGLKVSGIPHFFLVASGVHLCCNICRDATKAVYTKDSLPTPLLKKLNTAEGKAPEVNKIDQTVRAEFYNEADVMLFKRSIEDMGLAAKSISIEIPGK